MYIYVCLYKIYVYIHTYIFVKCIHTGESALSFFSSCFSYPFLLSHSLPHIHTYTHIEHHDHVIRFLPPSLLFFLSRYSCVFPAFSHVHKRTERHAHWIPCGAAWSRVRFVPYHV